MFGQVHGFGKSRLVHHQAGGGQNSLAMGADHGPVDARGEAKVVRIHDEAAAAAEWPLIAVLHHWVLQGFQSGLAVWALEQRTGAGTEN
ncbi:hypothetical protein SBV1_1050014 [Verrucomicrobia bacterium]|nr:hypothetical protein SBV1_1050014 [Verrucomicrobiota bacterium]